ncbi:MAG: tetratricopeptide repeat protein [Thermodesulfobacteriota bacterium]
MRPGNRKILLACIALAAIAFLVYLPAVSNGFVNWDDQAYVYENPFIRSLDIRWLLTTEVMGNWHPLTMLSFVADYAIWGLDPRGYHLVNVILHSLNTGLVAAFAYLFFRAAERRDGAPTGTEHSGALFAAVVAALLFGLHPQRVESVAWISERKDVLSGFYFLLSLVFYMRYAVPPRNGWAVNYAASLAAFVLAVMSKPMAVTLPAVLLLLDLYPLGRLKGAGVRKAVVEKVPFFAVSVLTAVLAVWAQRSGGALASLDPYPMGDRVMVAGRAVVFYLYKMALPFGLAPFYPRSPHPALLTVEHIGAFAVIAVITVLCIAAFGKKRIYLALWLFYLVTLVPVAGIVQVGSQAAADRYTYLPSLAPVLLIAAGAGWLFNRGGTVKRILPMAVVVVSAALSVLTIRQIHVWKDPVSLWTQEVRVYPDNAPIGYTNLGIAYKDLGDYKAAIRQYDAALKVDPLYADAFLNRGVAYSALGEFGRAIADYSAALRLRPGYPEALSNRGVAFMATGDYRKAIADMSAAIAINPDNPAYAGNYYNRGMAYSSLGEYEKALADFEKAIGFNPYFAGAYNNRGGVYLRTGRYEEALRDYETAARLEPDGPLAYYNMGVVYVKLGQRTRAVESFRKASSLGLKQADRYLEALGE